MTELEELKSRPLAFLKICNRTLHTFACTHEPAQKSSQAKECNFANSIRIPFFVSIIQPFFFNNLNQIKMKSKQFLIIGLIAIVAFTGCKGTKKISKATGSQEITVPFSESKYKSDKDFFRAKQTGKSPDLATAKKIALQNAKAELAGNIKSLVKRVTDQYTNQRTISNKQDFENKFEELSREVVDQTITDVKVMDEKIFKEQDGGYSYWVVIEVSKQAILDGVSNKISKNEKLLLDYDKKKFEDVFNSEMEKMSKEQ